MIFIFNLICMIEMKSKKHDKIIKDYERQKRRQIEKLATKMLENDEKFNKLKGKEIDPKFLNLF